MVFLTCAPALCLLSFHLNLLAASPLNRVHPFVIFAISTNALRIARCACLETDTVVLLAPSRTGAKDVIWVCILQLNWAPLEVSNIHSSFIRSISLCYLSLRFCWALHILNNDLASFTFRFEQYYVRRWCLLPFNHWFLIRLTNQSPFDSNNLFLFFLFTFKIFKRFLGCFNW